MAGAPPTPTGPHGGTGAQGVPVTTLQEKPLGNYTATAYCNKFGPGSINGITGVTAGGTNLNDGQQHYVIAAGVGSGLKMGDKVKISPDPFGGDGIWTVDDHGKAIVGKHIDIYVADCAKAQAWGHRQVDVRKVPDSYATGATTGSVSVDPFGIGGFLSKLGILFQGNFWLRVFMVLAGMGLILFAIVGAGKQYAIGSTIGKVLK